MSSNEIPQAEISNGLIRALLYLPDTDKGYYRGCRFDWSGNMPLLEYKGHRYFDQWYSEYSPEIHDVIMGPVEEFTQLDYPEIQPGDSFVKIGSGVLNKPDNEPYDFRRPYKPLNRGKWAVRKKDSEVLFIQDLEDKIYSYHYEKSISLIKDKPELVLHHTLKNTCKKTIETTLYDHNFFMIDKTPIGPGMTVKFPFDIKGGGVGIGDLAEFRGGQIVFLRTIGKGEEVWCESLTGFGKSISDYDIRIENHITGAGARVTCDKPFNSLAFWACPTTLCPEPYIKIKADPGKEISWNIRYEFYTF